MRALGTLVMLLVVGCGSDGGGGGGTPNGAYAAFSCAAGWSKGDGGSGSPVVCVEASSGTPQEVEQNRQTCEQQGSTFALGACTRTGAVGGCRVQQGGQSITTWYYGPDQTESDIQQLCAGLAGTASGVAITFVAP